MNIDFDVRNNQGQCIEIDLLVRCDTESGAIITNTLTLSPEEARHLMDKIAEAL